MIGTTAKISAAMSHLEERAPPLPVLRLADAMTANSSSTDLFSFRTGAREDVVLRPEKFPKQGTEETLEVFFAGAATAARTTGEEHTTEVRAAMASDRKICFSASLLRYFAASLRAMALAERG
eukprot:TRINITY_DN4_c0_g1_i3.p1 TRINITY_DN4_c0_g1~~TRINITY_DN4_c0_g1_i3.p1  ORF type:complete len:123 (+),score=22.17 TRINITY_DN4_c0_g1_i3:808-1176(+)